MVEIVFENGAKGAMRCAQSFSHMSTALAATVFSTEDGTPPSREAQDALLADLERRREEEARRGKPLGGKREDVLGLCFVLDMGEIGAGVTSSTRRELLRAIYLDHAPPGMREAQKSGLLRQMEQSFADYQALLTRASSGEPVRIWYSDAPGDLCGSYHVLHALRDCGCRVSAVKLPRFAALDGHSAQSLPGWGGLPPGDLAAFLPLEREVPPAVRQAVSLEWERLMEENAPLRVVLNGRLHSAGVDLYDPLFRAEIPDGPFSVGSLIGAVMERGLGIGDWHIARRIGHFIKLGELRVVRDDPCYYSIMLEKNIT